jgi:hypothetical protein
MQHSRATNWSLEFSPFRVGFCHDINLFKSSDSPPPFRWYVSMCQGFLDTAHLLIDALSGSYVLLGACTDFQRKLQAGNHGRNWPKKHQQKPKHYMFLQGFWCEISIFCNVYWNLKICGCALRLRIWGSDNAPGGPLGTCLGPPGGAGPQSAKLRPIAARPRSTLFGSRSKHGVWPSMAICSMMGMLETYLLAWIY